VTRAGGAEHGRRRAPRALRLLAIGLAAVIVVVLLFTVVFPWFDATFVNDPVLGAVGGGPRPHGD
jgi:hypothetical protein